MALEPITREEKYLAKAAGQSVEVPEPITRKEMFLNAVAKSGGGSSGGGGATKWEDLGTAGYLDRQVLYVSDLEVDADVGSALVQTPFNFVPGKEYEVYFHTSGMTSSDRNDYKCIAEPIYEEGIEIGVAIGNTSALGGTIESEAPFVVMVFAEAVKTQAGAHGFVMPLNGDTQIVALHIDGPAEVVNPIPERYLPEKLQGFGTVFLYAGPEGEVPNNSSYRYLYNSADTTNAANRVTREEALAFVHSGRAIYFVDSGGDENVYYLQLIVGRDNGEYVVLSTEFGDQIISYCTAEHK